MHCWLIEKGVFAGHPSIFLSLFAGILGGLPIQLDTPLKLLTQSTLVSSRMHFLVAGSNFQKVGQLEQVNEVKLKQRGRVQLIQLRPLKKGWPSGQLPALATTGGTMPTQFCAVPTFELNTAICGAIFKGLQILFATSKVLSFSHCAQTFKVKS